MTEINTSLPLNNNHIPATSRLDPKDEAALRLKTAVATSFAAVGAFFASVAFGATLPQALVITVLAMIGSGLAISFWHVIKNSSEANEKPEYDPYKVLGLSREEALDKEILEKRYHDLLREDDTRIVRTNQGSLIYNKFKELRARVEKA